MLVKDDVYNFRSVKLPILTPDLRDRSQALIKDAKELRDKDTESTIEDLISACDRAEAALRVTYRTLTRYRAKIPGLITKLKLAKEVDK